MAFHTYTVSHLHEFIEVVEDIGRRNQFNQVTPPVLWARGHRQMEWNLRPTLLRTVGLNNNMQLKHASGRALEEELRKEHYIAKNYHFFQKDLQTSIEWMEVMQHHEVKTRLLDWSESPLHSLIFSLQCFMDEKYTQEDRIKCSPNVWLLDVTGWNMVAIEKILSNDLLIDQCVDILSASTKHGVKDRIDKIAAPNMLDQYLQVKTVNHLKGIFNLSSVLNEFQQMQRNDLEDLLTRGELYYCIIYVLAQTYMKTDLRKYYEVMPLGIVEAYHSERIRAQRGVFTLFPYYEEDSFYKAAAQAKIYLDSMEFMKNGNRFLHRIRLNNAEEIAYELINSGMNISWLYPEMPTVSNTIERRGVVL